MGDMRTGALDRDLWGPGSRRWVRMARRLVRAGRRDGHAAHKTMWHRFGAHWQTLEAETWRPLIERARERDAYQWGREMLDWRHGFLATALETAYRWGADLESEPDRTTQLRAAVDELRDINRDLLVQAARMVELFERREELRNRFTLDAEWSEPGADLWALLEEVSQWPQYRGTCLDTEAGLERVICYMQGTSRPTPTIADLLNAFAMCVSGEPVALLAGDREALAKLQGAKPGAWPERVRQLFAELSDFGHRWQDRRGHAVTLLDCFTSPALAALANVAAGFNPFDGGPPALGVEAIEKALRRYRS